MAEHDEVYGAERQARLIEMLRDLARRLAQLDGEGHLLDHVPELLGLLGEARSELFHYEVRSTYDTPEVAENRKLVEELRNSEPFSLDEPEDDAPWRQSKED